MSEHGGKREGAGRKPKADEQKLIEKLSPLEETAFAALEKGLEEDKPWAVKMYFEYVYGKPRERVEVTDRRSTPIFRRRV